MDVIYAEYNIHHNSIDIATTAGYLLRIVCWEAEMVVSYLFKLLNLSNCKLAYNP